MYGAARGARPHFAWTWLDPGVAVAATAEVEGPVLVADPGADLAIALLVDAARPGREIVWIAGSEAEAAVAALKVTAAVELPVEGYRSALGLDAGGRRVFLYHLIRGALPAEARAWWDRREALLREGFARCGAFERLLERLRQEGLGAAPARALRRLSPGGLARVAELPEGWGPALAASHEGALVTLARRGDLAEAESVWPQLGRAGHAALAADRGARLRLERWPLGQALRARPWGAVVLGPLVGASPDLRAALAATPPGCRLLAWTGSGALPEARGLTRRADLEGPLRARDRSLLGGLWVADRAR